MKKILILGAGKSASWLIKYLLSQCEKNNWECLVADADISLAQTKIGKHPKGKAVAFDANNLQATSALVSQSDLIISLLPPTLHFQIARLCLQFKRHLVTASYLSTEMKLLHTEAKKNKLIFLNEMGLDPGIDHMSAKKIIDNIAADGGELNVFKSYCGGLISDNSDNNPWNYKFTWNPRNVVLAGQSAARYLEDGKVRFIPPQRIFSQIETIKAGKKNFDAYANRDSLSYIEQYGIQNCKTVLRGTLRKQGFCKSWNVLVNLGLTDDTYQIDTTNLTYAGLLDALLPKGKGSLKTRLLSFSNEDYNSIKKIEWLGLLKNELIGNGLYSPASILQSVLEKRWKLEKGDLDMIVMVHEFRYTLNSVNRKVTSTLILKGEEEAYTAMAKTVGLPIGIAAKLILNGKIKKSGVLLPLQSEIYNPVLQELESYGIIFQETHSHK